MTACFNSTTTPQIELWFGGDVHLGSSSHRQFNELNSVLTGAIGFINLEGPVSESSVSSDKLTLINAPASLTELLATGVSLVGVANNHAVDAGQAGVESTIQALRAAGLQPVGGPAGYAIFSYNGLRLVFTAHDLTVGVPAELANELVTARNQGDLLIATFHTTGVASYLPQPVLQQAVSIALAAGATIIVAHGSHALGPVERKGEAVIAWGLGNLAFNCDCTNETDAIILRVSLSQKRALTVKVIPIEAGLVGQPARLARQPDAIIDLLEAIGSTKLTRFSQYATF
ncbi:MAG: CapA family protein [Acidobacteriota bacterium]